MKIRNGFVSNSSSSSFIMIGVELQTGESNDYRLEEYTNENGTKYVGVRFDAGDYTVLTMGFESLIKSAEKVMLYYRGRKLEVIYGSEHD